MAQTFQNGESNASVRSKLNANAVEINSIVESLTGKQATLVSAINIKTINGQSILGSGDLTVSGGSGGSDVNFTAVKDAKLASIAANATVNDTDANLRNRSTHTGMQATSTITGLDTALAGKMAVTTFKTINGNAITGSGDIVVGGSGTVDLSNYVQKDGSKVLSTNDYTTAEKTKLAGLSSSGGNVQSNLTLGTRTATTLPIANSDGSGVTLPVASTTLAGLLAAADKVQVDKVSSLEAAIAAATPLVQPETIEYLTRLKTAGYNIDLNQINSVDALVVKGKANGWWSKVKDLGVMCGTTLGAASIKLKKAAGSTEIVWTGFVESDYSPTTGLDPGPNNTTKFGDLGFTFPSVGLTYNNWFMAAGLPYYNRSTNPGFGAVISLNPTGTVTGVNNALGFNGNSVILGATVPFEQSQRIVLINSSAAGVSSYACGVDMTNEYSLFPAKDMTGPVQLFKAKSENGEFNYFKSVGCYAIGESLTLAQRKSLSLDLLDFMEETQRLPRKRKYIAFGDSITQGGTHSATAGGFKAVAQKLGYIDFNFGRGSSMLGRHFEHDGNQYASGVSRYPDIFKLKPDFLVVMYGTNDIGYDSNGDNGGVEGTVADPGLLTGVLNGTYGLIDDFQKIGCKIIFLSPPWRSDKTAKVPQYIKVQSDVCVQLGVPFVDTFNPILDTGAPTTYFPDGLHPNQAGYALLNDHILKADQGILYRLPTLDFPSIAAGGFADLTVTMYSVRANNSVTLGPPSAPVAGIVYQGFVSADDTVTVRAINVTNAAINPDSQVIRVQVNI